MGIDKLGEEIDALREEEQRLLLQDANRAGMQQQITELEAFWDKLQTVEKFTNVLKAVVKKYKNVYQMELLTDNTEKTKAFYRSVGFTASDDIDCVAFIRM